ncbi:hypothetical protein VTK73DRAFT_7928 [Phialemonium thermophilum]|uniref:NmrA-like domain-containing protein n=1 Tax=Phialemonium thermophilum TaxID=223376 RepID=A0ABR3WBU8_9PEZI
MSQRFPTVAVAGATGNLGVPVVKALQNAQPPFRSIVILTRKPIADTSGFAPNVQVRVVDYASHDSLVSALSGVDALVSAMATQFLGLQDPLLDAAVAAGVRFFIPSEFGLASGDPRLVADFPLFTGKKALQDRLAALRGAGKLDYALLYVGLWLDWGLLGGTLMDVRAKKVAFWDGGHRPISMTTLDSIAKAVVGVLQGQVHGRTEVRIKDVNTTQRHLYELATQVVGADGWDVTDIDTAQVADAARQKVADGTATLHDLYSMVPHAASGEKYGQPWKADEDLSEALGLQPWTDDQLLQLIRKLASSKE